MEGRQQPPGPFARAVHAKQAGHDGVDTEPVRRLDHCQRPRDLAGIIGFDGLQRVCFAQRAADGRLGILEATPDMDQGLRAGTAREIDEGQRQLSIGEARSSGIDLAGIDTIGGRVEDPVVSRGRVDLENATGMPAGKPEDANRRWKGPLASGHDRYIMTASGKRGDESRSHESPSASHERLHDLPPSGRCWKQDKANPQVAMPPPSDPPPRNVRHRRALRVWLAHKTE